MTAANYYQTPQTTMAGAPGFIPGMVNPAAFGPTPGAYVQAPMWGQTAQNMYGGFQTGQPAVFNINGTAIPFGNNDGLTEEDVKNINAGKKKPFEIDPVEVSIAKCTHKRLPGDPRAGQPAGTADENDMFHCDVCTKDFKLLDLSQEEVDQHIQVTLDIMDNIKLKWLNVPKPIIDGIYIAEPIIRKLSEAYRQANADWNNATASGKVYQAQNLNTNQGYGFNGYQYTPVPTQYNTYNPYMGGIMQPYANSYMMGAQPNIYSNPIAAQPQAPQYYAPNSMAANHPLVQPQAAPVVQPQPATPATPPVNPYGMPTVGTPATTTPSSGYQPNTGVGTPDPTKMTTTTTAQTI